jgi:hypothetical protein
LIVAPVRFEYFAREGDEFTFGIQQDAAAHGFDTIDREDSRWSLDLEAREARPISDILLVVARFGRDGLLTGPIDARVDGVEDAPTRIGRH